MSDEYRVGTGPTHHSSLITHYLVLHFTNTGGVGPPPLPIVKRGGAACRTGGEGHNPTTDFETDHLGCTTCSGQTLTSLDRTPQRRIPLDIHAALHVALRGGCFS